MQKLKQIFVLNEEATCIYVKIIFDSMQKLLIFFVKVDVILFKLCALC